MFKNSKPSKPATDFDTLIGQRSVIEGDIQFTGGLHVDGRVSGSVVALDDDTAVLHLSEKGTIEGEVRVPHLVINGTMVGDIHAAQKVELAAQARIKGNVYYKVIVMAAGAEVNGSLIHSDEPQKHLTGPEHADQAPEEAQEEDGT